MPEEMKFHSKQQTGGFTLMEILFVVSIVVILMTATVMHMRSPATGISLKSSVDESKRLVDLASQVARSQQVTTRLVINVDPATEGYLRQAAIVWSASYGDPSVSGWQMVGAAKRLGQDAYFEEKRSKGYQTSLSINFQQAAAQSGGSGTAVVYYEFDHNGHLKPQDPENPLASIIFTAGVLSQGTDGATLTIPEAMKSTIDGIYLRRSGQSTRYDSPNQIP